MKRISKEKYDKYNKLVSSKKSFQVIYYLCLVGIFTCLLLLCFVKTFITRSVTALSYNENSTVDYNVKLKPNEYYDTDTLPSGMDYIASLISSINLNFDYDFTTNSSIDYDASYYVEAITRVYGKDNKNVVFESITFTSFIYMYYIIHLSKILLKEKEIVNYSLYSNSKSSILTVSPSCIPIFCKSSSTPILLSFLANLLAPSSVNLVILRSFSISSPLTT